MKYSITATISTLALVLALAAPSRAACPPTSKEFTANNSDDWNDNGNWNPSGEPGSADDVCIPDGLTVSIWAGQCSGATSIVCDLADPGSECDGNGTCESNGNGTADCAKLDVLTGGGGDGTLYVRGDSVLNVNGVAVVDGLIQSFVDTTLEFKSALTVNDGGLVQSGNNSTIVLHDEVTLDGGAIGAWNNAGAIKLAADITITGDGGEIKTKEPYTPFALIESGTGAGSPYTLTLEGVNNASEATSLTLHGNWDVRVPVVNNAFVNADDDVLALHTAPITGTGMWDAGKLNTTPGTLVMNVAAGGSGDWCLQEDSSAKITFQVDSTGLSSNFNLEKGTLEIREHPISHNATDVTTTGDLNMVSIGTNAPLIIVRDGCKIIFSN